MDYRIAKLAASGAIVGLLGVGGVSIASAQDSDPSSTTAVESSQDDTITSATTDDAGRGGDHDGEDCPDHADSAASGGDTSDAAS